MTLLLYYITDRTQFPGNESSRRKRLLEKIAEASRAGIDYVQLREKDLSASELESLAGDAVRRVKGPGGSSGAKRARILINSRSDIALSVGADGVHLRAGDISAADARNLFAQAGVERALVAVSCHSPEEVRLAESQGADFVVFGPVFENHAAPGKTRRQMKKVEAGAETGLHRLREACASPLATAARTPVLALGGITTQNFSQCLASGAAGVAGIRLFQENDLSELVPTLRGSDFDEGGTQNKNAAQNRRHPYLPG